MIYSFMLDRRNKPMELKDLFQELIESTYYDGKPVPEDLLVSILLFIQWAAHETTVGHVSSTLIDLLQNPDLSGAGQTGTAVGARRQRGLCTRQT